MASKTIALLALTFMFAQDVLCLDDLYLQPSIAGYTSGQYLDKYVKNNFVKPVAASLAKMKAANPNSKFVSYDLSAANDDLLHGFGLSLRTWTLSPCTTRYGWVASSPAVYYTIAGKATWAFLGNGTWYEKSVETGEATIFYPDLVTYVTNSGCKDYTTFSVLRGDGTTPSYAFRDFLATFPSKYFPDGQKKKITDLLGDGTTYTDPACVAKCGSGK